MSAGPASSGHLSSSLFTPSPSVSGIGQPSYLAKPETLIHLSSSSFTPSASVSGIGQPPYFAKPATVGHLSTSSVKPSLSVSTGFGTTTTGAATHKVDKATRQTNNTELL